MISEEGNNILSSKRDTVCKLSLLTFFIAAWFFVFDSIAGAQEAQSGYSLIGTIQSDYLTGAVVAVAKDEQSFFRKFDKLPDGSQIVEVWSDSILLKRPDGTTYEMYILHETKTVASVQNNVLGKPFTPEAAQRTQDIPPNAPLERIPNSHGKRRQGGNRSADDE